MTPAPSPATGAADRVELPGSWKPAHLAPKDGSQSFWRGFDRNGKRTYAVIQWPEFDLCFEEGEFMLIPGDTPPSSGAGAAGLEEVAFWRDNTASLIDAYGNASANSAVRGYENDGTVTRIAAIEQAVLVEDTSRSALIAAIKARDDLIENLSATIARQADDLERLRGEAATARVEPSEEALRIDAMLGAAMIAERAGLETTSRGAWAEGMRDMAVRIETLIRAAAARAQIARPSADQREGADEGGGT